MKFKLFSILVLGIFIFSNASCSEQADTNAETPDTTSLEENQEIVVNPTIESTTIQEAPIKPTAEGSTKVKMVTSMGTVTILLYDATPKHRDNFVKLVNEKFYEGLLFHRIIKEFMIQGGDPDSKNATPGQQLGAGGPGYTLEAEIIPGLFHKKGALSAARQGDQVNPEKRSSGSQFYIVTGKVTPRAQLESMAAQQNQQVEDQLVGAFLQDPKNKKYMDQYVALQELYKTNTPENKAKAETEFVALLEKIKPLALKNHTPIAYSEEQKMIYETVGGTPFLDNNYTVFGEVIEGLSIVEKMGMVATAPGDRPLEDVKIMSMEIIK